MQVSQAARHSKADFVYGELKEAILSGAVEPGALIDKLSLCEKYGVSRFPVSSAISRLAFERLVVVEPQHGSFAARISIEDVSEGLFIRRALETEIAARAALRMSAQGKDALAQNVRDQQAAIAAIDRPTFYALDVAFHRHLTKQLGLNHSGALLDGLRAHLERVRRLLMTPEGRLRATLDEHAAVAQAIARGDAAGARKAMDHHLHEVTTHFERFAREKPALFSP